MRVSDLLKTGLRNLFRRKIRTILTILGVVIGAISIILVISLGEGMKYNLNTKLKELGSVTMITVYNYGEIYDDSGNWAGSKQQKLNEAVVEQFQAIEHVKAVTPVVEMSATLYSGKYQGWSYITAMKREAFEAFEFPATEYGDLPNEEDNSQIVFGYNMPQSFYDPNSWMWKEVIVDITKDKVVLKFSGFTPNPRKKEFSLPLNNITKLKETGTEYDYSTYMDLEYFEEIYRKYCNTLTLDDRKRALEAISEYQQIRLNVDNIDNVKEVQDKITELGFSSYSLMQYVQPMIDASNSTQMILLITGIVAMFVSAINIANTMIMSIYERTKEIGIMKVLGCFVKDVRLLFLFEAGMIGFLGGVVGNGFGFLASWLINKYGEPLFGSLMSQDIYSVQPTATTFSIIPIYLPILVMGLTTLVGLVSGYLPARRATKISAIEAMKSEG